MRFSLDIVNNLLKFPLSPENFKGLLKDASLVCDTHVSQESLLRNYQICQVLDVQKHPNADSLFLCSVKTSLGEYSVVCGAQNVRSGMHAVFCPVGQYSHGMGCFIQERIIRGCQSNGMLCSYEDIGVYNFSQDNNSGIIDIDFASPSLSASVGDVLGCTDHVFDVDIPTNRVDLYSFYGLLQDILSFSADYSLRDVEEDCCSSLCQNFSFSSNLRPQDSILFYLLHIKEKRFFRLPKWLKNSLFFLGYHGDDIHIFASYYSLLFGVPVTVYPSVCVQAGKPMLDYAPSLPFFNRAGKKIQLTKEDIILVSDNQSHRIFCGLPHYGSFDPLEGNAQEFVLSFGHVSRRSSYRTNQRLGLHSLASVICARGIFLSFIKKALEYLLSTLHCQGFACNHMDLYSYESSYKKKQSVFCIPDDISSESVYSSTGFRVGQDFIVKTLCLAHCTYVNGSILPPEHRADLVSSRALIGEVMRHIEGAYAPSRLAFSPSFQNDSAQLFQTCKRIRRILAGFGFHEVITYPFVEKKYLTDGSIHLLNPMQKDKYGLRMSLLSTLISVVEKNIHHGSTFGRIFEQGSCFSINNSQTYDYQSVAFVEYSDGFFPWKSRRVDIYSFQSFILSFLNLICLPSSFSLKFDVDIVENSLFHSDCFLNVYQEDRKIGYAGMLHSALLNQGRKKKYAVFGCEVNVHSLKSLQSSSLSSHKTTDNKRYNDFSFVVKSTDVIAQILSFLKSEEYIYDSILFDVYYMSEHAQYSFSLRVFFKDDEGTDSVFVSQIHKKIFDNVYKNFGVEMRKK